MTSNSETVEQNASKTIEQWHPVMSAWERRGEAGKRIGEGHADTAGALILRQGLKFEERELAMLSRAMELNGMAGKVYLENRRLNGQAWYDKLWLIVRMRVEMTDGGGTKMINCPRESFKREQDGWQGPARKVEAIRIVVSIDTPAGPEKIRLPTDFAVGDPWETEPDYTGIVVTAGSNHEVEGLAKLIRYAIFSPKSDDDSDSYETQEADFRRAAHKVACEVLLEEKAAERIVAYAAKHLLWDTLPRNTITEIETGTAGEPVTVRVRPRDRDAGTA